MSELTRVHTCMMGVTGAAYQEDGQLELIVEHHGVHAARPTQPCRDVTQEVSVEDEEEDS